VSENGLTDGFHLCGHSMGGYLAALYAFERPERIQSLMLASPVGLPSLPDEAFRLPLSETPWQLRVVNWLWSSYATPMQIIRLAGFKGPALVHSIIARRFSALDWNEQKTKVRAADEHCVSCASSPRASSCFRGLRRWLATTCSTSQQPRRAASML
jgi:pimeloyl-ACP methyl ester carboxylesterase